MGILDNQFFTCPSYAWGLFVLSLIVSIALSLTKLLNKEMTKYVMAFGAFLTFTWAAYCLFRFASPSKHCHPKGYGVESSKMPWDTTSPLDKTEFGQQSESELVEP